MYNVARMDIQDFVEEFKYQLALLPCAEPNRQCFDEYRRKASTLRSQMINILRWKSVPGWQRAEYNRALGMYMPDYKRYLFKLDPRCQLCNYPILSSREATIDHIIPLAEGGGRGIDNQQLAHAPCNVLKSADFNHKSGQHKNSRCKFY